VRRSLVTARTPVLRDEVRISIYRVRDAKLLIVASGAPVLHDRGEIGR
jgi:hypothetical protein